MSIKLVTKMFTTADTNFYAALGVQLTFVHQIYILWDHYVLGVSPCSQGANILVGLVG